MMLRLPVAAALLLSLLGGCAHTPPDEPSDPLEAINRPIFRFNQTADRYVLRPVARGYVAVVPEPVRGGIGNFFSNLFYPTVILNDLLQGKFAQGGEDLGRFVLNTTVGLGGFMDVASRVGLPANDEDFGQTLGTWGVGPGWYLMLPLLGPASNRDLIGRVGDYYSSPTTYTDEEALEIGLNVLNVIDTRAGLLDADRLLEQQFDPYLFLRTVYLQRRLALVHDGNPPRQRYDFEDDFDE
ncbi:MAG TPA: VacJ family lipoprotein [Nevskiaceae bacterium]|nr:VacJ family lipoprotein [Nevskiaceae bacterium]